LHTLTHSLAPADLALAFTVPLVIGLIGGLALMAILPFAEWATGSLSDITLIEYGSHHELLDVLRDETPGTWNHTIMVADLAESAARAIGAEALFCRTAALYHDIGKTRDPNVFAENQRGVSPHARLSPQKSAEKIIAHVTDGLDLAKQYRLPAPLRAIIAEHHGTSLVRFFFAKAADGITDPAELEKLKKKFRYPGPPPSTRESGIIALADTIEAAARSMPDLDEAGINNLVFKLIADRIEDGELNECTLTLAELALVRESFANTLVSRHHKRPVYPAAENKPVSLPRKTARGRRSRPRAGAH
jgi:putative nucleotidyltransferase with HDIG domain